MSHDETRDHGRPVRVTMRIGRHEETREGTIYRTLNAGTVYEVDFGHGPQRLRAQDQVQFLDI